MLARLEEQISIEREFGVSDKNWLFALDFQFVRVRIAAVEFSSRDSPRDSIRSHDSSDSHRLSRITLLPADGPVLKREHFVFRLTFPFRLFKRFFFSPIGRPRNSRNSRSAILSEECSDRRSSLQFAAAARYDGFYFCVTMLSHCFSPSLSSSS